jgi:hypothetical protein
MAEHSQERIKSLPGQMGFASLYCAFRHNTLGKMIREQKQILMLEHLTSANRNLPEMFCSLLA